MTDALGEGGRVYEARSFGSWGSSDYGRDGSQLNNGCPAEFEEDTFTDTQMLGGCGDFQVLDQFVLNFRTKLFFDENGEPVRIVEQINGTDTFINSDTGKNFTSRFQNTEHIDLTAGPVRAVTGVQGLLTVPGSGAVLLDVGRIVTNLETEEVTFQAGPHQLVEPVDLASLCAALE
jgi:hypothetical protein